MAVRTANVGDPAIIDGRLGKITEITADYVEFKDQERLDLEAEVEALRAMPTDSEAVRKEYQKKSQTGPLEQAANDAKEAWMAGFEAAKHTPEDQARLLMHGHIMPGGQRTRCSLDKLFWVDPAQVWSCNGRLLDRREVVETHVDSNGVTRDTLYNDEGDITDDVVDGNFRVTQESIKKQNKIHRKQGKAYNPAREIAAHVVVMSQGS